MLTQKVAHGQAPSCSGASLTAPAAHQTADRAARGDRSHDVPVRRTPGSSPAATASLATTTTSDLTH